METSDLSKSPAPSAIDWWEGGCLYPLSLQTWEIRTGTRTRVVTHAAANIAENDTMALFYRWSTSPTSTSAQPRRHTYRFTLSAPQRASTWRVLGAYIRLWPFVLPSGRSSIILAFLTYAFLFTFEEAVSAGRLCHSF